MFRFKEEPSSGSYNQSLAKTTSLVQLCVSVQTFSVLWRHMHTKRSSTHLPDFVLIKLILLMMGI